MPLVIAHRGASAYEPENSLAAFRRAVALRADGIELDVHQTGDGAVVVVHDPLVNGRRIAESDLAALRKDRLSNGEPVPTLAEALDVIGSETYVFIEVKGLRPDGDAELLRVIDAGPAPAKCCVHAFDHRTVKRLRALRSDLPAGVLSASYPIDPVAQVTAAGATVLWQAEDLVDAPLAAAVHAAGLDLYAWTVDDRTRMSDLVDMGVDGLCSNVPDVARGVVG